MTEERRLGKAGVSTDMMRHLLGLPETYRVLGVEPGEHLFWVIVEGPDLPVTQAGDEAPEVVLEYQAVGIEGLHARFYRMGYDH